MRLFSIGYVGGRESKYRLHTTLPGFKDNYWHQPTEDEAKALAERLLADWLAGIGAEMKQEASA